MGQIGGYLPTLLDVAKRSGSDGRIQAIVEILNQSNRALDDVVWVECNDGHGHRTTVRSGLPSPTWRLLNYGVQPSKSTTVQVTDSCGMLEDYAEMDAKLAELNGNTAAFRLSEDMPHIEGMNQSFLDTLFHGNVEQNPERFMGLLPRFNSASAETSDQLVNAGGSANRTSVYLVGWGPNTVHCLYPKGSKAGLQHEDLGKVTLFDAQGGRFEGYRSHYSWDCGLTVRDWKYVVRIHSIDVNALTKNAASGADLIDLLVQAREMMPEGADGISRLAFYCNKDVRSFLRRQLTNRSNVWLSMDEVAGKRVLTFDGVPVRRVDKIGNAESALAA